MVEALRRKIIIIVLFSKIVICSSLTAQAVTCSPLSYQLATDTLRAKWGAPFNVMLMGEIVSIKGPICENWEVFSEILLTGVDLKTNEKKLNLSAKISYVTEWNCSESFNLDFFDEGILMGQKIFFLETDIFSLGNGLVIQPTICGTSVWDISLKPIIRKCFVSSSCSIDWFEKRDLPDSYFETFYK